MNVVRKYTTKLSNIELNDESSKCAICLEENDITSRKLSCNHKFHLNCLAALVKSNQRQDFHELKPSYLCPMCKEKWNSHKLKNQKQESKIDDKLPTGKITLEFTLEECERVKSELFKHGKTLEDAIFNLLGL
jgi:hypothetical protein